MPAGPLRNRYRPTPSIVTREVSPTKAAPESTELAVRETHCLPPSPRVEYSDRDRDHQPDQPTADRLARRCRAARRRVGPAEGTTQGEWLWSRTKGLAPRVAARETGVSC